MILEFDIVDIPIQLISNNHLSSTSGYVIVFRDDEWVPICSSGWDDQDATVLCRTKGYQLGKTTEHSLSEVVSMDILLSGKTNLNKIVQSSAYNNMLLRNVQCSGNETIFSDCIHGGFKIGPCDALAGVICEK